MKLLSPKQNSDLKLQEQLKEGLRTKELEEAASAARLSLANAQADFNTTLAQNRQKWALEEEEHNKRVLERKTEIDRLEAEKQTAMLPVTALKAEAERELAEANEFAANLIKREEYLDDVAEKLQDNLDDVGAREADVKAKELELNIRLEGLEHQNISVSASSKALTLQMAEFVAYSGTQQADIEFKRQQLQTRASALDDREAELNLRSSKLDKQAIRLADERGTLDRGFKELKRKTISP